MKQVHLVVYSDYLCPWCFNVSVRLHRLEEEMGDRVKLEWRSYLLRPQPQSNGSLEEFRTYTRSWLRPAQEDDAGTFRVWSTDAGPPSHSIPPHLIAKLAAQIGRDAFVDMHQRLLSAYFSNNRDITDRDTLATIWNEAGLPAKVLDRIGDPQLLGAVLAQHDEAIDLGINGVPAVRPAGQRAFVTGALSYETYRRWVIKLLGNEDVGGS
jgi:predicted DsbA family dithiol-disulfide isomerase